MKSASPLGRVAQGGRREVGVWAPADIADRDAIEALDAPLDLEVGGAALLGRASSMITARKPRLYSRMDVQIRSEWGNLVRGSERVRH